MGPLGLYKNDLNGVGLTIFLRSTAEQRTSLCSPLSPSAGIISAWPNAAEYAAASTEKKHYRCTVGGAGGLNLPGRAGAEAFI